MITSAIQGQEDDDINPQECKSYALIRFCTSMDYIYVRSQKPTTFFQIQIQALVSSAVAKIVYQDNTCL